MTRLVFDTPLWQAAMASLPQEKQNVFDLDVLKRIIGVQQGIIADVSPETCMKSPTVHAIITAITRRFAVTPLLRRLQLPLEAGPGPELAAAGNGGRREPLAARLAHHHGDLRATEVKPEDNWGLGHVDLPVYAIFRQDS